MTILHPEQCPLGKTYLYEPDFDVNNYVSNVNGSFSSSTKIHWDGTTEVTGSIKKSTSKSPYLDIGSQISISMIFLKHSVWTSYDDSVYNGFVFLDNDMPAKLFSVWFAMTHSGPPLLRITITDGLDVAKVLTSTLAFSYDHRYKCTVVATVLSATEISVVADMVDLDNTSVTQSGSYNFTSLSLNSSHSFVMSASIANLNNSGDYFDIIENYCISPSGLSSSCRGLIYADFTLTPSYGNSPLLVQFTDTSGSANGITSYFWEFGDGATSTLQNPSHTYARAGSYVAVLTVSGPDGSSTSSRTATANNTVTALGFYGTPTSGSAPLKVSFFTTSEAAF